MLRAVTLNKTANLRAREASEHRQAVGTNGPPMNPGCWRQADLTAGSVATWGSCAPTWGYQAEE